MQALQVEALLASVLPVAVHPQAEQLADAAGYPVAVRRVVAQQALVLLKASSLE